MSTSPEKIKKTKAYKTIRKSLLDQLQEGLLLQLIIFLIRFENLAAGGTIFYQNGTVFSEVVGFFQYPSAAWVESFLLKASENGTECRKMKFFTTIFPTV